nr:hypothetical protein [Tanacetum cinerariifolium]
KLSRKGKSVKCNKCGNLGHNRKGCRGQGSASQTGGYSQAGARQAAGARNVSVKLLVQGMTQVKMLVLVNPVQHEAHQLVQGMP